MNRMARSMIQQLIAARAEKELKRRLSNLHSTPIVKIPKVPDDFEAFNRMIGLPISSDMGKPSEILSYQVDIDTAINKKHRVIINKSRKIGVTETVLRSIAKNCFFRYAEYNVMIVAGNRQSQAQDALTRLDNLFERGFTDLNGVYFSYHEIIKKKTKSSMEFFNGTKITIYPPDAKAVRGPARVACVLLDEAAHIKHIDDAKVYDALRPNLANTNGDFIIVSTPNGSRGIFYDLWMQEKGPYHKMELPYTLALGGLLSEDYINQERENGTDFEQEYDCKFTTTKQS